MFEKIQKNILNNKLNRITLVCIVLIMLISAGISLVKTSPAVTSAPENFTTDTIIPAGFVLIPIDLQNSRSLDGIMGPFGVVDLFTVPVQMGQVGTKVGDNIKIIRSPYDPSQFAVLVPEDQSALIVQHGGQFTAVIQNPKSKASQRLVEAVGQKKKTSIHYFQ